MNPASATPEQRNVLVIEPGRAELHYWRDLWRYRELFYFLAWRDLLVRYKQTVVGVAWAVFRPFLTMLAFTLVFGVLGKFPSDGVPYPILVYCAMLPWQFFANAVSEASNSLISNANLVSKVYFPRLIIPASAIITGLVDLMIAGVVMLALMAWYGFWPDWRVLALPFFIVLAFFAAMGCGLWLTALTVKYRDFRFVVPFIVQFGLYISPVGFTSSMVPEDWRLLYSFNPMVGVIEGFRWSLTGGSSAFYLPGFMLSLVLVAILFMTGLAYFRRVERSFADVI